MQPLEEILDLSTYTVDVTSDIGELKQASLSVWKSKNKSKAILVPLTSVVTENDKKLCLDR